MVSIKPSTGTGAKERSSSATGLQLAVTEEQLNRKMDRLIAAQNPTVPDGFRMP